MTTTTAPLAPRTATDAPLRRVIRVDVVACAGSGALLLAAAGPLADVLDVTNAAPIQAAGAFLVVLGLALAVLARTPHDVLVRLTPWSAAGDALWATGSLAIAAAAPLSGVGRALVAAQGLAVAGMAVAKLMARRHVVGG